MPGNSYAAEPPRRAVSVLKNVVAFALLMLATTHCVLSYFFVNQTGVDLRNYANGAESRTFQGRLLMSFILRATQHSAILASLAARFTHHVPAPEPNSVYKVTSILVALPCVLLLGCALTWYSRRAGLRPWWLPWSLLLAILYVSLAAKYEQNLWYPYDLPHIAVFGLATICIFLDEPWWFLPVVLLDIGIRETAIFSVALAIAMHHRRSQRAWWTVSGIAAAAWIASRIVVHFLYLHNQVTYVSRLGQFRYLVPWHLPQLFTLLGFLPIPLLLNRRFLPAIHQRGLIIASLLILATFAFAVWAETRAWAEWSTAFAIWAAMELTGALEEVIERRYRRLRQASRSHDPEELPIDSTTPALS